MTQREPSGSGDEGPAMPDQSGRVLRPPHYTEDGMNHADQAAALGYHVCPCGRYSQEVQGLCACGRRNDGLGEEARDA